MLLLFKLGCSKVRGASGDKVWPLAVFNYDKWSFYFPSFWSIWKYVDYSIVSETIHKGEQSYAQSAANEVNEWSKDNLFLLNCDKTKDLVINYSRQNKDGIYSPVLIDGQPIRKVTSVKLLGIMLNSYLKWNNHVEYLVKTAFQKLYFFNSA
jgi:hypothetical protein